LLYRFECAYPILENGYEQKLDILLDYLNSFVNLYSSGRNGLFAYSWVPDIMLTGQEITQEIISSGAGKTGE
jgi:protoporphyrinogen oxidase